MKGMAIVEFRWNEWNREHATKHGCTVPEIEMVVRNAGRGFPRYHRDGKYLVNGRGTGGRMVEVILIYDDRRPGDTGDTAYVVHAMPLTLRRRRGR
jgi:hypothetical protein